MRVTIVDVEWLNKESFTPNHICSKLSSFHKQLGDDVTLVNETMELNFIYDKMYIVRKGIRSTLPKVDLRSEKVELYGEGLRFYSQYKKELPDYVAACRPDYALYPLKEENVNRKVNLLQFFSNGKRLEIIQDYERAVRATQINKVVDKDFWKYNVKDLEVCCKSLSKSGNVFFEYPVSLQALLECSRKRALFLKLPLQNMPLQFEVDYEDSEAAYEFIQELHETKDTFPTTPLVMHINYTNHLTDNTSAYAEFERLLKMVVEAKAKGVWLVVELPDRFKTHLWFLFEELHVWTKNYRTLAYVEFMTMGACFIHQISFLELVSTPSKWSTVPAQDLTKVQKRSPSLIEQCGYIKWGEQKMEYNLQGEKIWEENVF